MKNIGILLAVVVLLFGVCLDASAKNKTKKEIVLVESFFEIVEDYNKDDDDLCDLFCGIMEGKIIFSKEKLRLSLADSICRGQITIKDVKTYSPKRKRISAKIDTNVYCFAYAISFYNKSGYSFKGYPKCTITEYTFNGRSYNLVINPGSLI